MTEADTCRKFVVPKLQTAGWDNHPHSIAEQRTITDGRIVPSGKGFIRKPPKRADYILRYERNFALAVVEPKAAWRTAGDGIQQAKEYAELLQVHFAYATNGPEIIEFDYFINFEQLAEQARQPEADAFDLLCHLAYNAPLRTRRERAQRLRSERKDFFEQYGPEARQILDELLEKYAEHGEAQFVLPDVLKVPPMSNHGQVGDIVKVFGGADRLRAAVNELQTLLYAA